MAIIYQGFAYKEGLYYWRIKLGKWVVLASVKEEEVYSPFPFVPLIGMEMLGDMIYLMSSVKRAAEAVRIWTEENWDVKRVNALYSMIYGRFIFKINKRFDSLS